MRHVATDHPRHNPWTAWLRAGLFTTAIPLLALCATTVYSQMSLTEQIRANNTAVTNAQKQAARAEADGKKADQKAKAAQADSAAFRLQLQGIHNDLASEGPLVRSEAWYTDWNSRVHFWYDIPQENPLLVEPPGSDWHAWLNVQVINDGQFKATVTGFALQSENGAWADVPDFECLDEASQTFGPCDDSTVVGPQEAAVFRFALNSDVARRSATCSSANNDGLQYRVDTRGVGTHWGKMLNKRSCVG